jgi:hypothetical protein
LGVTGLALFLTSVINSARRTMTLFHAICLFHLLALVGISVSPKGRYPMTMMRYLASRWLYYLAACMFLASAVYLFAKAPTYGSQTECNAVVVIVIFGVNVRATSAIFRWIFVAALALLLFGVVIYCVAMCFVFICCSESRRWFPEANESATGNDDSDLWSIPKDRSLAYLLGRLGACSYVIGMLELMIRRNKVSSDESLWTFGQVLAMVMLVGPVIEIFSLTLGRLGR